MDVIIKRFIVFICLLTLSGSVSAQKQDSLLSDFCNSILKKIIYPRELLSRCTPTFTVLKITVDNKGEIDNMKLSDSADPLFVVEWLSKKKFFDLLPLKKYIKQHSITGSDILLPINYTFSSKSCSTMDIDPDNCLRLFLFEGKPAQGSYYIAPPINLFMKFTVIQ